MSGQKKKKTLAQLRTENEQRREGFIEGIGLLEVVNDGIRMIEEMVDGDERDHELSKLLLEANRACELIQHYPRAGGRYDPYIHSLTYKADIHEQMGNALTLALPALRQVDELYVALERDGLITRERAHHWEDQLVRLGDHYLEAAQLEAAKRCFLKLLSSPRWSRPYFQQEALRGMARYHRERED
jgi:tetratricopeptide (TPR) repeat protein